MSTVDLDAIRARARQAARFGRDGYFVTSLLTVAEEDVPALLAEVERRRADVARVRALHSPEPDARDAKRMCRHCDVRAECLAWALEHELQFGIWGGTTPRERRRINQRREGQR